MFVRHAVLFKQSSLVTQKLCCAKKMEHIHEHGQRRRRGRQLFDDFTGPDLVWAREGYILSLATAHPISKGVSLKILMWK